MEITTKIRLKGVTIELPSFGAGQTVIGKAASVAETKILLDIGIWLT